MGFKAPLIQRVIYALNRLRLSCCCWCSRYRLSHADMEEGSCSRYGGAKHAAAAAGSVRNGTAGGGCVPGIEDAQVAEAVFV